MNNVEKTYLILGGNSDVGIRLLHNLNQHQKNCVFIVHGRRIKEESFKGISTANGNNIVYLQSDLSDRNQVDVLLNDIMYAYGAPNYIVYLPSAPIKYERFKDLDLSALQNALEISVYALLMISKQFIPIMAKRKIHDKVVIMLSSYTIEKPPKYLTQYMVAKYAQLGLMKSMAVEYAGKGLNINAISPSMMETKFLQSIDNKFIEIAKTDFVEKRLLNVEEIVPAVEFLLSPASDAIHGINLNISNGNVI